MASFQIMSESPYEILKAAGMPPEKVVAVLLGAPVDITFVRTLLCAKETVEISISGRNGVVGVLSNRRGNSRRVIEFFSTYFVGRWRYRILAWPEYGVLEYTSDWTLLR